MILNSKRNHIKCKICKKLCQSTIGICRNCKSIMNNCIECGALCTGLKCKVCRDKRHCRRCGVICIGKLCRSCFTLHTNAGVSRMRRNLRLKNGVS